MEIRVELKDPKFLAGIVIAHEVAIGESSPELRARIEELARRRAHDEPNERVKEAVRALLRRGGFKPNGRSKPASEYLAQAAREDRFPFINNLVDSNNLLSLDSGLPISLLDLEMFGGKGPVLRYGTEGEKYVFNDAGHEIELAGLLCVCREDGAGASTPLGNAVKDSMLGKLKDDTRSVLGVIYASDDAYNAERVEALAAEFAGLLKRHGKASAAESRVARGL